MKQERLSQKLLLLRDLSFAHPLQSIDHLRRRHRPVRTRKCIVWPTLLPYQRVAMEKEAPTFHLAVCHARTATRLAIGQEMALIPRRTTTRSRAIQMDIRDMCTIPPWKRFPLMKLSQLVYFLWIIILLLFYLILELRILSWVHICIQAWSENSCSRKGWLLYKCCWEQHFYQPDN